MPILFDCPFCSYEREVPDSYSGKKIKCPRCLATLTLGLEQPIGVTALPLPEEDLSPLETTAIEVDEKDSLIECPICLALINSDETQCPAYKAYLQALPSDDAESKALEAYQKSKAKVKKTFTIAISALLLPVAGILLGPLAILQGKSVIPSLCENLEMENRQKVNVIILMGIVAVLNTVLLIVALMKWIG